MLCSPNRPCEPTTPSNSASPLTTDVAESYSDWNSNAYGGCFKCHSAVAYGETALTNEQLAQAHQNMTEWAAIGYTPIVATTVVVGGMATVPGVVSGLTTGATAACADDGCAGEVRALQRFGEYFSESERGVLNSLYERFTKAGFDLSNINFWRAEPGDHGRSVAMGGGGNITLFDNFFKASTQEQLAVLAEEYVHVLQSQNAFGPNTAAQLELEAAIMVEHLLSGLLP